MFRDLDETTEDEFYNRILTAWNEAELNEKDADLVLSRLILDILEEDRRCSVNRERTLMKILTNCIILVLALINHKPLDMSGINLTDLPVKERKHAIKEIAAHYGE